MPHAIIIAGPNGAGKTTFARSLFDLQFEGKGAPEDRAYHLNADEIARMGVGNLAAGKLMLKYLDQAVNEGRSFLVETTLASQGYRRRIPDWKACGYTVSLHFITLDSADLAVERVARRVAAGGHPVSERDIRRRYHRGLDLFESRYKMLVDHWDVWRSYQGGFESVQRSD